VLHCDQGYVHLGGWVNPRGEDGESYIRVRHSIGRLVRNGWFGIVRREGGQLRLRLGERAKRLRHGDPRHKTRAPTIGERLRQPSSGTLSPASPRLTTRCVRGGAGVRAAADDRRAFVVGSGAGLRRDAPKPAPESRVIARDDVPAPTSVGRRYSRSTCGEPRRQPRRRRRRLRHGVRNACNTSASGMLFPTAGTPRRCPATWGTPTLDSPSERTCISWTTTSRNRRARRPRPGQRSGQHWGNTSGRNGPKRGGGRVGANPTHRARFAHWAEIGRDGGHGL
jgi:hypothetical protein